ncbi:MAG TPA: pentapeptide repeat-containing protein [Candidatus Acidoferrum sp.]|nr:pentapeptide repeat-containing protein [Candidatus Acidoferrum sp.]
MPNEEHRAIEERGGSGEGCPVKMQGGKVCGRRSVGPIIDGVAYCLMHMPTGKNDAAFQEEFDAILRAAGDGVADFTEFVFPSANYEKREFRAACLFLRATFMQGVSFSGATFTQGANFGGATFAQGADFTKSKFILDVDFSRTKFMQDSVFSLAEFTRDAYFDGATFTRGALFDFTTFTQTAGFNGASFGQNAHFETAMFMRDAFFERTTFADYACFDGAAFMQKAYFGATRFAQDGSFAAAMFALHAIFFGATFEQRANFMGATFAQDADFAGATFADASFTSATCPQRISFARAKFLGPLEFRHTQFRQDKGGPGRTLPGPIFSLAEFAQPEKVLFYKTYLGQAVFANCDVSRVNFSLVDWRRRKGRGKWMVFEEEVDLEAVPDLSPKERGGNERDYGIIAQLYRQLKKNYDEHKDYWVAGDFHYGEMEMARLAPKPAGALIRRAIGKVLDEPRLNTLRKLRRWWHRHLSLVAWYKYASLYGESYVRPVGCLALVLLLFTFLFPIVGLVGNDTKSPPGGTSATQQTSSQTANNELSYGHFSDFVKAYNGRKWLARPAFFGNSLMTALSVAGFQKELKYEPSYPWGRVLALLELLLTSTLAALFLLAVRRQFRR